MTADSRHLALRTLAVHLILLVGVLTLVGLGARQMYSAARDEIIGQTRAHQRTLAAETARGIEHYYASIFSDMGLLRRPAEDDSSPGKLGLPVLVMRLFTEGTRSVFATAADPDPHGVSHGVGRVLWMQLSGRIATLLSCDRSAASADAHVTLMGSNKQINPDAIVQRAAGWIQSLHTASVGLAELWSTPNGSFVANVLCVPVSPIRALVALVPLEHVESDFLRPVATDPTESAWLVDQDGAIMAASRTGLAGVTLSKSPDTQVAALAGDRTRRSLLISHPFTVGKAAFAPSMIAVEPVSVADRHWLLIVTGGMAQANQSVDRIAHRTLEWGAALFVVLAAILGSTAAGLMRARMRVERLRHEVISRELAAARRIQLAWLPAAPLAAGRVDVAAVNLPASHVSGDFYNWFTLDDGRIAVVIGDVSGHGLAAAFLMATAQLLTRNTLARTADPATALTEVNLQLCAQALDGQFVTMQAAILDPGAGTIQLATAGHPAPLIAGRDGICRPLTVEPRLMLGIDGNAIFATETHELPPGAAMVLYTDGIVEAPAADGSRFGINRLIASMSQPASRAQLRAETVIATVEAFRRPGDLDDDLTVMVVALKGD